MSCQCCCTHGHTAIQEKRNSLMKDYWRIILSTLLLFGSLILNATDATFFKGCLLYTSVGQQCQVVTVFNIERQIHTEIVGNTITVTVGIVRCV